MTNVVLLWSFRICSPKDTFRGFQRQARTQLTGTGSRKTKTYSILMKPRKDFGTGKVNGGAGKG